MKEKYYKDLIQFAKDREIAIDSSSPSHTCPKCKQVEVSSIWCQKCFDKLTANYDFLGFKDFAAFYKSSEKYLLESLTLEQF